MPDHSVILLAEDDEDYVLLIQQAFVKAHVPNPLHVVSSGKEAMAYLKGEGKYANRAEYPLPYDFEDLVHFTQLIQEFWLQRSKCPDTFRAPKTQPEPDEPVAPPEQSAKTDA